MLIVWMIFGSRLCSFSMLAFYFFLKCLPYTANRHRKVWKLQLRFRLVIGATYFLTLSEIATRVWVATHALGLIAYFISRRCKVHCADESRGTHWDGQKNDVITFSRDAKINTVGSTFSGELQTALLIGYAKQKIKLLCHYTTFLVF